MPVFPRSRWRRALVLALLAALLCAGYMAWYANTPVTVAAYPAEFEIPQGAGLRVAARMLGESGIDVRPRHFELLARATGRVAAIKAGNYELTGPTTAAELLDKLTRGAVAQAEIRIIEGWTFAQLRAELDGSGLLRHDTTGLSDAELLQRLGRGGMGVVFRARQLSLQREVALKVIAGLGEDAAAVARFLGEARAAAQLHHPHIVPVYEVGEHEGTPFLVMELLDGETVADRLARGPLGPFEACAILVPALDALDALHQEGLVHLDIKPANVFVTSRGVKLVDFGLTRGTAAGDRVSTITTSGVGLLAGTPSYMAPEQVRGEAVDARTDVFAAGVLLFELVTGERPFRGATFVEILQAVITELLRLPVRA